MTNEEVERQIRELKSLQSQIRWWSWGSVGFIVLLTVFCMGSLANSVRNLFQPGPSQTQFTAALSENMKRDVLPSVQIIAGQAITQSRPEVEAAFRHLNGRVPELTQFGMGQLALLQKNIPAKGTAALNATYGDMLKKKEPKLRQMFPEATDENVSALVKALSDQGLTQAVVLDDSLFSKHTAALSAIQADLTKIQQTEPVPADGNQADWETALIVVDSFHEDLKTLEADAKKEVKP